MNYATGCAFNMDDMFMNFPYKKLEITCEECKKINNDAHRQALVKKIFRECYKLVLNDIIDNNVTFELPTGARPSHIHMRRTTGDAFQRARKYGKWKEVDFLESLFSGYELVFNMYGKKYQRTKNIYVDKKLKKKITDNTNKGMSYC